MKVCTEALKIKVLLVFLISSALLLSGCQGKDTVDANSDNPVIQWEGAESESMEYTKEHLEEASVAEGTVSITDDEQARLNLALESVEVPSGYALTTVSHGEQDKIPVTVYRYTQDGELNPGGEHFSITMDDARNKLLGFTFMNRVFDLNNGLIEEAEANSTAIDFLNRVEPGLVESSSHLWTSPHHETIEVEGEEYSISGIKYKCYSRSSDLYYWVIVGHDGQIITFEQDIVWSNGMSERISEQWLHDWWRTENNNF